MLAQFSDKLLSQKSFNTHKQQTTLSPSANPIYYLTHQLSRVLSATKRSSKHLVRSLQNKTLWKWLDAIVLCGILLCNSVFPQQPGQKSRTRSRSDICTMTLWFYFQVSHHWIIGWLNQSCLYLFLRLWKKSHIMWLFRFKVSISWILLLDFWP